MSQRPRIKTWFLYICTLSCVRHIINWKARDDSGKRLAETGRGRRASGLDPEACWKIIRMLCTAADAEERCCMEKKVAAEARFARNFHNPDAKNAPPHRRLNSFSVTRFPRNAFRRCQKSINTHARWDALPICVFTMANRAICAQPRLFHFGARPITRHTISTLTT